MAGATHTLRYTTGSPWSWNWNGPGSGFSGWPPGHSLGNSTSSWIFTPLWTTVIRPGTVFLPFSNFGAVKSMSYVCQTVGALQAFALATAME